MGGNNNSPREASFASQSSSKLEHSQSHLRPQLMAILNVTPDSFSDGGSYATTQAAVDAALRMVDDGADLIDVGGESTRPGAAPVSAEEEIRRVAPVVQALVQKGIVVSVDTMKADVAEATLQVGAQVINDVTGLGDRRMASVCAAADCSVCIMHIQGTPQTMQANPVYQDVVSEVRDHLLERAAYAQGCGVPKDKIWIDPGIGFGKADEHNLALLRRLDVLVETGYPVLLGVSRKGFIGRALGGLPVDQRVEGTLAVQVLAQAQGVRYIRAHDVLAARRAIDMTAAVLS